MQGHPEPCAYADGSDSLISQRLCRGRTWLTGKGFPSVTTSIPQLPSETPKDFKPVYNNFEYERREVMIPIRDGVKLHTVIIVPKSVIEAKKHAPILEVLNLRSR